MTETPASEVAENLKDLAQSHPLGGLTTWESDLSLYPSSPEQPAYFFITKDDRLYRVAVTEEPDSSQYREMCGLAPVRPGHYVSDGYRVTVGARFWSNDLRVVEVTSVADHSNPYSDTGETQTWHGTTGGSFDTLTGPIQPYGRLARFCRGKDAALHQPGTEYRDVK